MRSSALVPVLGLVVALAVAGTFLVAGRAMGHAYGPPWICDDTRYVVTVPLGRAVVGPALAPPPGCGQ